MSPAPSMQQPVVHIARRVVSLIGVFAVSITGPGIEPDIHLHHLHAGFGVARHHRTMDRRAPRQRGRMRAVQVETAQPRRIEDRLGQQQAVGDDHRHIEAQRGEGVAVFRPLKFIGVRTSMPWRAASLMHRRPP